MLQATLRPKAATVSKKINNFHFFPIKSLCHQIWPWRKMCQGKLRVIIWTTLVVLALTMLHTKFQGHWSIGSGEEDFLRFLPYMGMAAMLVMWPNSYKFSFLFSPKLSYEFWLQIASLFLRKTSFNFVIGVIFDQGQRMTLTYDTHWRSLTHLAKCFKQLWDLRLQ